jgi:hypothetical protein
MFLVYGTGGGFVRHRMPVCCFREPPAACLEVLSGPNLLELSDLPA